jgi:hypothetical protein
MSRVWAGKTRADGWVMECDTWDPKCPTRSEASNLEDLTLERFAREGWFIARTHGDLCPECVTRAGGMSVLLAQRGLRTDLPGSPHSAMAAVR